MAWRIESTPGFHAVMNMLLMPIWFLSGAVFPATGGPGWMRGAMAVNPLSYGVSLMRYAFYGEGSVNTADLPSLELCLVVTIAFCALPLWGAVRIVHKKTALV